MVAAMIAALVLPPRVTTYHWVEQRPVSFKVVHEQQFRQSSLCRPLDGLSGDLKLMVRKAISSPECPIETTIESPDLPFQLTSEAPVSPYLNEAVIASLKQSEVRRPMSMVTLTYSGRITPKKLVADPDESALPEPKPLRPEESKFWLTSHYVAPDGMTSGQSYFELTAPSFIKYLERHDLNRHVGEDELGYAYRIYNFIADNINYYPVLRKVVSRATMPSPAIVVELKSTSSEGICTLFSSILMRNGIPSRVPFGFLFADIRNAQSGEPPLMFRSEFYSEQYGWIPVRLPEALMRSRPERDNFFADEDGGFLPLGYRSASYRKVANLKLLPFFLAIAVEKGPHAESIDFVDDCYSHKWNRSS